MAAWEPGRRISCAVHNCVYIIFCMKCRDEFYVGKTEETLSGRISGHRVTSTDMSKHFSHQA